jgi:hypothetical protein
MDDIPEFPLFRSVKLSDRLSYEEFYKSFEPYSDFCFNNLWVWFNQLGQLAFSEHNGNLVIRLINPFNNNEEQYSVLGINHCEQTFKVVFEWQRQKGIKQQLTMVPQAVLSSALKISKPFFDYTEDPDNRDYIYDVETTYESKGGKYEKYRHALSYFSNYYSEPQFMEIDLKDYKQRILLINRLHTWDTTYRQSDQARIEGAAIDRYLFFADDLPVKCLGMFMDGALESFALYQLLPQKNFAAVNHLKANNAFNYIFDITFSQLIKIFHQTGIRFVSLEQDLGLPGLRTHKERLRPSQYLYRYTVKPIHAYLQSPHTNNQADQLRQTSLEHH